MRSVSTLAALCATHLACSLHACSPTKAKVVCLTSVTVLSAVSHVTTFVLSIRSHCLYMRLSFRTNTDYHNTPLSVKCLSKLVYLCGME